MADALSKRGQFWWGTLGAVAPYLVRAAQIVSPTGPVDAPTWAYLLVHLSLILLGGFWSIATESHARWLAFYHGGTAPVVVSFLLHVPAL